MPDPYRKPQVNISCPTAARMWLICFCAALAVFQSARGDSGLSLIIALTSVGSCILTELLITCRQYGPEKIKDGSAVASALVLTLLLPNRINPLYAAAGSVFAMAVVKHSFGGLGSNWLNPGLGGWLFIRCSWPRLFAGALEDSPLSLIAAASDNALPALNSSPMELIAPALAGTPLDGAVTSFLNNTVFALAGAELPAGYIDLLVSRAPGIIADRGLFALLLGTVVLIAFRTGRSWVPALYLAVFGILTFVFGDLPFRGRLWNGDVLFAFLSGGTVAAAFILAAEPASGAKSGPGILITVILSASLAWVFRYCGFEMYGCLFAALLVNAAGPVIRFCEGRWLYARKAADTEPEGTV